ncbi:MAG: 50S ribosomal protein L3 [Microscillaceae bacterium]|nr:50S ribosomal protein L3 [Microscillaceae bacterium]
MSGLIGKKIGMTSIFQTNEEEGITKQLACTVVEVGPCVVTQVKTQENDGYMALQLAFGEAKEKNMSQPMIKHFQKANTTPKQKVVEFRDFVGMEKYGLGDILKVDDIFTEGDFVDIIGISKGKGFQGVVKRHGFGGVGDATHGQHNRQRAPGSLGASSFPSRVLKGLRMAGRTGSDRIKIQNLQILKILPEKNILVISGAIPGAKNSFILIEK